MDVTCWVDVVYIRMLHRCCMSAACCMDVASYMNAAWMLHGCGMVAWTLHGARCMNVAYTTYSHGVEIVFVCVCVCVRACAYVQPRYTVEVTNA